MLFGLKSRKKFFIHRHKIEIFVKFTLYYEKTNLNKKIVLLPYNNI